MFTSILFRIRYYTSIFNTWNYTHLGTEDKWGLYWESTDFDDVHRLFKVPYDELMHILYVLSKEMNLSYSDMNQMSFFEILTILEVYKENMDEQKKQQAYQQTANVQQQVVESESLIKSDANVATFDYTKNAAREASEYFQQLLKDENAVISVSERFGQLNGLTSFTVNVKRATGEVESLRYALKPILDSDGNETGEFYFGNVGAELNNSGAIKQIKDIENAFSDYTAKLSQFKSTNSEILSGLTTPLSDFETKLELARELKILNNEIMEIKANCNRKA